MTPTDDGSAGDKRGGRDGWPAPGRAADRRRSGPQQRPADTDGAQAPVSGGRSGGHRAGQAPRRRVLGGRADARAPSADAPDRDRRIGRRRRAVVPVSHHGRGPQAHPALPRTEHLRGRRPGAAAPVSAIPQGLPRRGADHLDARSRDRCLLAPGAEPARAGPGGHRRRVRAFAVRLRSARKRQDGDRPGSRPPARGRDRDPARHRDRRAHHAAVRSGQPRAAAGRGRGRGPDCPAAARRAMGAVPPAAGDGGRRAEPRRRSTWPTRPSRATTRRRFRPSPTAACW